MTTDKDQEAHGQKHTFTISLEPERAKLNDAFVILKAALQDVSQSFGNVSDQEFVLTLLQAELCAKDLANLLGHTRVRFGQILVGYRQALAAMEAAQQAQPEEPATPLEDEPKEP